MASTNISANICAILSDTPRSGSMFTKLSAVGTVMHKVF